MTHNEMENIANKVVDVLALNTPDDGLPNREFCELMQAVLWSVYCQLKGNLGPKAAMMALGQVLQIAAEHDPAVGVSVDLVPIPKFMDNSGPH